MIHKKSILHGDSADRKNILDMIQRNYLYYGASGAMSRIQNDFDVLYKKIFSKLDACSAEENVEMFDFLIFAIHQLRSLPFSLSDLKMMEKFKAEEFLIAQKILQVYRHEDPTGYGKAASRLHNALQLLQPVFAPDQEYSPALGSPTAKVVERTFDVAHRVHEFFGRVGDAILTQKDHDSQDKRKM